MLESMVPLLEELPQSMKVDMVKEDCLLAGPFLSISPYQRTGILSINLFLTASILSINPFLADNDLPISLFLSASDLLIAIQVI